MTKIKRTTEESQIEVKTEVPTEIPQSEVPTSTTIPIEQAKEVPVKYIRAACSPDLQKRVAYTAKLMGVTVDTYVADACEKQIQRDKYIFALKLTQSLGLTPEDLALIAKGQVPK